jgi:hypothetical protein
MYSLQIKYMYSYFILPYSCPPSFDARVKPQFGWQMRNGSKLCRKEPLKNLAEIIRKGNFEINKMFLDKFQIYNHYIWHI